MAIRAAVKTCTGIERNKVRMVMIRNTGAGRPSVSEPLAGGGKPSGRGGNSRGALKMSFDRENLSR